MAPPDLLVPLALPVPLVHRVILAQLALWVLLEQQALREPPARLEQQVLRELQELSARVA